MKTKKKTTKKVIKKKITKKTVKKVVKEKAVNKEKKLGKVTHYFDKIKVAAIKLNDDLLVGQTIRIEGGESTDFKQKIVSMQFMGEKIKKGKKKQEIGIKVKEKVREGYKVFKVS